MKDGELERNVWRRYTCALGFIYLSFPTTEFELQPESDAVPLSNEHEEQVWSIAGSEVNSFVSTNQI